MSMAGEYFDPDATSLGISLLTIIATLKAWFVDTETRY